jgi:hypothetical protein
VSPVKYELGSYIPEDDILQGLVLIQTYIKNCNKNVTVNTSIKQMHSEGLMLGFACSVPDFWLEVSLNPEGPATDKLDQGFPWFSLVPEQMRSWYPNSTLLCMLHMQPSPPNGNFKIFV